jgi:hypothetical protein
MTRYIMFLFHITFQQVIFMLKTNCKRVNLTQAKKD